MNFTGNLLFNNVKFGLEIPEINVLIMVSVVQITYS
jgi:hypothetical protein